jgi:hypothetical protein
MKTVAWNYINGILDKKILIKNYLLGYWRIKGIVSIRYKCKDYTRDGTGCCWK